MPIGPITPGSYVTVTPDSVVSQYTSVQAPSATMPVIASDIQDLTLVVLNVQNFVLGELAVAAARKLDKIDGGTVSGPTVFTGDVDFQGTGANRPSFQGGLHVIAGGIAVTAGDVGLSNGSLSSSIDLTVGRDGLIARHLTVGGTTTIPVGGELKLLGSVIWRPAVAMTNANHSVGVVSGDSLAPDGADAIIVPPAILSADRDFTVRSAGAKAGNRMRFYSNDNAFKLNLKQDDGTIFALLKAGSPPAFGYWNWIEIEHNGSANGWFPIGGLTG
jgi:hypothetical protein